MSGEKVCVPTADFHAIQQMAHMYHHLFDSGIGLRQVLDYYFVLETLSTSPTKETYNELLVAISHIGMGRFASAMMYVLQVTMGLDREKMLCEPNEEDGRFLLGEIMRGGNFGRHDDRKSGNTHNYFVASMAPSFATSATSASIPSIGSGAPSGGCITSDGGSGMGIIDEEYCNNYI